MRRSVLIVTTLLLTLAFASPAFAHGENTGRAFGEHVSMHALEHGGFTGTDNPGVHHQGFSNWWEHHTGI